MPETSLNRPAVFLLCAMLGSSGAAATAYAQPDAPGARRPAAHQRGPHQARLARAVGTMPRPGTGKLSSDGNGLHTCRVQGGKVQCKGPNGWGQLGQGRPAGGSKSYVTVPGIRDAKEVAVGLNHVCALHKNGRVSCWGDTLGGQTGKKVTAPARGDIPVNDPSLLVLSPRRVPGISRATALVSGNFFSCVLDSRGRVLCWGEDGGSSGPRSQHTPAAVSSLPKVVRIYAGNDFACALSAKMRLSCWGSVVTKSRAGKVKTDILGRPREVFRVSKPSDIRISPFGICRTGSRLNPAVCWGRPYGLYPAARGGK